MDKVYQYADYIAVNVSCPNTPDLTKLQAREPLIKLLEPLKKRQTELKDKFNKYVPLVVKSVQIYLTKLLRVFVRSAWIWVLMA